MPALALSSQVLQISKDGDSPLCITAPVVSSSVSSYDSLLFAIIPTGVKLPVNARRETFLLFFWMFSIRDYTARAQKGHYVQRAHILLQTSTTFTNQYYLPPTTLTSWKKSRLKN